MADNYDINSVLFVREWKKCSPDWENSTVEEKLDGFAYFCENYVHINHPSRGRIKFELRDAQRETVRAWLSNRANIALKARQVGFSTVVSIFCFWLTYFYEDRQIIMLSRAQREARKLLSHARYAFQFVPEWMKALGPMVDWTQDTVVFSNNSKLESMPSANDPARGSTAFLIVVDEIAFLPNSEEAYAAIEPVYDVGGRIIVLSTANGEGNLFHQLWVGSQTKAGFGKQFHGIFFSWRAGGRTDEWFAQKCAELPEWQRAQEYPDNPEEAFLKSGRPVFDLEKLRDLEVYIREHVPEPEAGRIDLDHDTNSYVFVPDGGQLQIWEHPKEKCTYVIGADIAQGLEHGDYSSAHVICADTGRVVAHWWGHGAADSFGDYVLFNLGHYYNYALIGPESNNHGLTTITALERAGYRNLFRQRNLATRKKKKTDTLGWNTNRATKPLAIDELGKAIRDDDIELLDAHTVAEMRTFVREGDGKMHGSPHDDRVMSLAIANQMLKYVWLPEYRDARPKPGPGTLGHLLKKMFADDEQGKRRQDAPIGAHSVRR